MIEKEKKIEKYGLKRKKHKIALFLAMGIFLLFWLSGTVAASEFTDACFENESVICNQKVLHEFLENKTVGNEWWTLTVSQREELAMVIISNYTNFTARYFCGRKESDKECDNRTWKQAWCLNNAAMRWALLGNSSFAMRNISQCQFMVYNDTGDRNNLTTYSCSACFGLPVYIVSVREEYNGPGFCHAITAIQVRENVTDFDSWHFFQYFDYNIKPKKYSQMPCGKIVTILKVTLWPEGYYGSVNTQPIAKWRIDKNCTVSKTK